MANVALAFDILARDRASKQFNNIGNAADRAGKRGAKFGKVMATVAVAGVGALGAVLKTGFGEVKDYQAGVADLTQTLKTMGPASGQSVKGIEALAGSIQAYSGQTDDSIVKSAGLLLTFGNLRDAAGKNNDVFTQATKLSADMAQKFGGDASSQAIKLGKALNDPTKGLTALTRIGVSFTKQQADQIRAMQKSGNIMGAQKIILAELTRQVGGSAKAYGQTLGGQVDRAKRSFEDVSQALATKMLPALTAVMSKVSDAVTWFSKHETAGKVLAAVVGVVLVAAIAAYTVSMASAAVATIAATWPILLIVAAVAAYAAGLVYAWKKSETFRAVVRAAMRGASAAVGWVIDKGKALASWFTRLPGLIKNAGKGLANIITAPYRTAFAFIAKAWNSTVGGLSFSVPDWVPGLGGKGWSMPRLPESIPALAAGGIVTSPTLALIGEAGPEAVVPLGRGGGLGGGDIHITVNGAVDPLSTARQIEQMLARLKRERGTGLAFA